MSTVQPVIVFDMDGVLVDVTASFRLAIGATVGALGGGAVSGAEIQALKNGGGFNNDWDLSREILRRRGIVADRARVIEVFDRHYLGDGTGAGLRAAETWLLPPAPMARLRRRFRLAVFTGRPRRDADYALRHFGVAEAFDPVLALEDVTSGKPDPEGLRQLRQRCAPARLAAYLGDTLDDACCAAAAGVPFYAIVDPAQASAAATVARLRPLAVAVFAHVGDAVAALVE